MLSKEEIEKMLEQNEKIITYRDDKDIRGLTNLEKLLLVNNKMIKEYIEQLNDIIDNKVHYIRCENCGIEMRVKRSDAKYCKKCSQKLWYKNLSEDKKKYRAEKSRISMQKIRLARKDKIDVK